MFYIELDNKIVLCDEDKERLIVTLSFMPQYADLEIQETDKEIIQFEGDFYFTEDPEYIERREQLELERVQQLYMTRSDFFDGTIMAWGVGQDELFIIISAILESLPIPDIKKMIAINNFKNALNFYRKHDLFTLLSGVPIKLSETLQVVITSEQWDRFFDAVANKNPEAYKELPTPIIIEKEV